MTELDSMQLALVLVVSVAGLTIITLLICKLFRRDLTSTSLMETSQILPKEGV